jgi:lactoylglutathione lyase
MEISLDHIGLSVADLEAEREFYARAFGFEAEVEFELAPHPIRGVMLLHPSGFRLELFGHEHSSGEPPGATPIEALATRGYGHFAIAAPDIEPLFAAGIAAGACALVPPSPSPEPGVRFAFMADPEGHLVELVERRPK